MYRGGISHAIVTSPPGMGTPVHMFARLIDPDTDPEHLQRLGQVWQDQALQKHACAMWIWRPVKAGKNRGSSRSRSGSRSRSQTGNCQSQDQLPTYIQWNANSWSHATVLRRTTGECAKAHIQLYLDSPRATQGVAFVQIVDD